MAIWFDLLAACGSNAEAVAGIYPVHVRLDLRGFLGDDEVPCTLIAPAGNETIIDSNFAQQDCYSYPVIYVLITLQDRDFVVPGPELDIRELLRQQIDQRTLSGVSSVWDTSIEPLDLGSFEQARNTVYEVTGFLATYLSWESRTNP